MSPAPSVTVAIPTYNRCQTLKRAVVSVITQEYGNLRLVISDDASTDDTQHFCRGVQASDNRVEYVRHPINQGATSNHSFCLQYSGTDYFMWLGDDDWLDPGYVGHCRAVHQADPGSALVCGTARYFSDGEFAFEGERISALEEGPEERVLTYLRQVVYNGVFYGLHRSRFVRQASLRPRLAGDWFLVAAVAALGTIRTVDGPALNRALGGVSSNIGTVAERLRLPSIARRHPWQTIALGALLDIAWGSQSYQSLGITRRLSLAVRAYQVLCGRFGVSLTKSVRGEVQLRTRLRTLLGLKN